VEEIVIELTTALLLVRDGVEKKANKYFNGNAMICLWLMSF